MNSKGPAAETRMRSFRGPRSGWLLLSCLALVSSASCGRTSTGPGISEPEEATSGSPQAAFGGSAADGGRAGAQFGGKPALDAGASGAGTSGADDGPRLRGAPLVFATTATEFGLNVALASGDPMTLRARARPEGAGWGSLLSPDLRAPDLAEWRITGLRQGVSYEYQIVDGRADGTPSVLYSGRAVTQRAPGTPFGFALISDTHIGSDLAYSNQGDETVLGAVSRELGASAPDFVINLGDLLDFHEFGFNQPPPDASVARSAYLNYREAFGQPLGTFSHFGVIGNWDGENGSFTAEEITRSRSQRLLYVPGPDTTTYPEGSGPARDYYAFSWGDALFVVLNVMSYTTAELLLTSASGSPEEWTLGHEQLAWLERTLRSAQAKWRFLFIHHAVGGAAGDEADSIYGRGGGRAAHVGEQAKVHQLMLDYGVQVFFYGHDHVFTDMVVDGIHYSDPGNAGAIWTFDGAQTGYTQYWEQSGWTRVDVTPDDVHVQFLAVGGDLLSGYTLKQ